MKEKDNYKINLSQYNKNDLASSQQKINFKKKLWNRMTKSNSCWARGAKLGFMAFVGFLLTCIVGGIVIPLYGAFGIIFYSEFILFLTENVIDDDLLVETGGGLIAFSVINLGGTIFSFFIFTLIGAFIGSFFDFFRKSFFPAVLIVIFGIMVLSFFLIARFVDSPLRCHLLRQPLSKDPRSECFLNYVKNNKDVTDATYCKYINKNSFFTYDSSGNFVDHSPKKKCIEIIEGRKNYNELIGDSSTKKIRNNKKYEKNSVSIHYDPRMYKIKDTSQDLGNSGYKEVKLKIRRRDGANFRDWGEIIYQRNNERTNYSSNLETEEVSYTMDIKEKKILTETDRQDDIELNGINYRKWAEEKRIISSGKLFNDHRFHKYQCKYSPYEAISAEIKDINKENLDEEFEEILKTLTIENSKRQELERRSEIKSQFEDQYIKIRHPSNYEFVVKSDYTGEYKAPAPLINYALMSKNGQFDLVRLNIYKKKEKTKSVRETFDFFQKQKQHDHPGEFDKIYKKTKYDLVEFNNVPFIREERLHGNSLISYQTSIGKYEISFTTHYIDNFTNQIIEEMLKTLKLKLSNSRPEKEDNVSSGKIGSEFSSWQIYPVYESGEAKISLKFPTAWNLKNINKSTKKIIPGEQVNCGNPWGGGEICWIKLN